MLAICRQRVVSSGVSGSYCAVLVRLGVLCAARDPMSKVNDSSKNQTMCSRPWLIEANKGKGESNLQRVRSDGGEKKRNEEKSKLKDWSNWAEEMCRLELIYWRTNGPEMAMNCVSNKSKHRARLRGQTETQKKQGTRQRWDKVGGLMGADEQSGHRGRSTRPYCEYGVTYSTVQGRSKCISQKQEQEQEQAQVLDCDTRKRRRCDIVCK